MTLISGDQLITSHFFSRETYGVVHPIPKPRASSVDLTIGSIITPDGRETTDLFVLKPGHMVQVVSAEVFDLKPDVTGHVTYKTELTKNGIWALTVGIVDPGWRGPVTTTLLNFSRVDHAVSVGSKFLRVSFFQHLPVSKEKLSSPDNLKGYLNEVRATAATRFPSTFLDQEKIAKEAGDTALKRIRAEALFWFAGIAIVFTAIQIFLMFLNPYLPSIENQDVRDLRLQVDKLELRLSDRHSLAISAPHSPKSD
ncbi:MAG: hypothetical protein RIC04_04450 [Parvibaculum sp.]|uniref:dCTP deaminase domain-containing protein n=1 Tax=Parvibaculum sp. TaxID=2024848 RepID=UPI0032EDE28C